MWINLNNLYIKDENKESLNQIKVNSKNQNKEMFDMASLSTVYRAPMVHPTYNIYIKDLNIELLKKRTGKPENILLSQPKLNQAGAELCQAQNSLS